MATFVTSISTPWTPDEAFDFMADLRNFERWDPGVRSVRQIAGDGGGDGHEFDVDVSAGLATMTLRYRTESYERPQRMVVEASNVLFTSVDEVTVEEDGDGSIVTYSAELRMNGPLGLFDLALRPVFDRIGSRAEHGLVDALDGTLR